MATSARRYSKAFWMGFLPALPVVLGLAYKAFPDCRCQEGWPWFKCCATLTVSGTIDRCHAAVAIFHPGPGVSGDITWDVVPHHPAITFTPDGLRCSIGLVNPELPDIPTSLTVIARAGGCQDVNEPNTQCDNPDDCTWTTGLGVDVSAPGNCGGGSDGTGGKTCGQTGSTCGNPRDPGNGQVRIQRQRVRVDLSLGGASTGRPAGTLMMDVGDWTSDMVSAANLKIAATNEVWPTGDDAVRILKTPAGCVKIIDTDPTDRHFSVEFYDVQDPDPNVQPFRTWEFEDPDYVWDEQQQQWTDGPLAMTVTDSFNPSLVIEFTANPQGQHGWRMEKKSDGVVKWMQEQTDDGADPPTATCQADDGSGTDSETQTEYGYFGDPLNPQLAVHFVRVATDAPEGWLTTTYNYAFDQQPPPGWPP